MTSQPIKQARWDLPWSSLEQPTLAWTYFLHLFKLLTSNGIVRCLVNQVFGFLYYSRSWLNLDGSIRCHHPRMSPVPSPHRPLLNPDWPQISHMPISIPTKQQKSPLMAFLAHGHELRWRTFVQKWLYSVTVIYVVGHILAIEQKLLAVSLQSSLQSFLLPRRWVSEGL